MHFSFPTLEASLDEVSTAATSFIKCEYFENDFTAPVSPLQSATVRQRAIETLLLKSKYFNSFFFKIFTRIFDENLHEEALSHAA